MNATAPSLNPSDTARRLGVSTKALRVYEDRGLLRPQRSAAGWRVYSPDEIARGRSIVELRALGLSLNEVARVLDGDAAVLERALAAHEASLAANVETLSATVLRVRRLRQDLARNAMSVASALAQARRSGNEIDVAFDLPWPWGGERFELQDLRKLTHIVGPVGSGKTRLARCFADAIPGAVFIGLDRLDAGHAAALSRLDDDPPLKARVLSNVTALEDAGASCSGALLALLTAIEDDGPTVHVVDMLEEGLDAATQDALIGFLRRRAPSARPLLFLTRSTAILDLDAVGEQEAIILCPANHSPPFVVRPVRGAEGFESLAHCLASPDVRARLARRAI